MVWNEEDDTWEEQADAPLDDGELSAKPTGKSPLPEFGRASDYLAGLDETYFGPTIFDTSDLDVAAKPSNREIMALLSDAATQIARLDERLVQGKRDRDSRWRAEGPAAPPTRAASIFTGWTERWAHVVAAAGARLDHGDAVDPVDLVLDDVGSASSPEDVTNARDALAIIRLTLRRRSEADLLHPQRLAAFVRKPKRLRGLRLADQIQAAPDEAAAKALRVAFGRTTSIDQDLAMQRLEEALNPAFLRSLKREPGLIASARLLGRWHDARAMDVLPNGAGRVLADLRLRLSLTTRCPVGGLAVGFQKKRLDYTPTDADTNERDRWTARYLRATVDAARGGHQMLDEIQRAERRLYEFLEYQAEPREGRRRGGRRRSLRSNSLLPDVVRLLVERPAMTVGQLAQALVRDERPAAAFGDDAALKRTEKAHAEAVRRHVEALLAADVVTELTGQSSFRVIALPVPAVTRR